MATPIVPGLHIPPSQVQTRQKQTKKENENGDVSILKLKTVQWGGMGSSVETLRGFPNSHWVSSYSGGGVALSLELL